MPHARSKLLRILAESERLYRAALPGATPTQKFVWQICSQRGLFVEHAAEGLGLDREAIAILSLALSRRVELLDDESPGQALAWAKRRWRHVESKAARRLGEMNAQSEN